MHRSTQLTKTASCRTSIRRSPRSRRGILCSLDAAATLVFLLLTTNIFAGSATWSPNPVSGDWNTAANWTPPTVPNGAADTATFESSNVTDVTLLAPTTVELDGIVFSPGASAFTITLTGPFAQGVAQLTISGTGITNNSEITQNFVTNHDSGNALIVFAGNATAGNATFTNIRGTTTFTATSSAGNGTFINKGSVAAGAGPPGNTTFEDSSDAGNATFTIEPTVVRFGNPGVIYFQDTSSAANGTFVINGSDTRSATGGSTSFLGNSTAGNGTFFINGGIRAQGHLNFYDSSSTGNATLIANGGQISVDSNATGAARVELFGHATLYANSQPATVGSIEGNGSVHLFHDLIVGTNNRDTNFSGLISEINSHTLTKVGTGTLVLENANIYSGGTIINGGKLVINNTQSGSGTGAGPVQVNAGGLGGLGTIAGDVTVGDGLAGRASLSPGSSSVSPGTLTIQSTLTFNSDATYRFKLNIRDSTHDEVVAAGVTINSGARFVFVAHGPRTLYIGTVFTVINNTATTPIAGTFSNLADGSTFTVGSNTYQVSYEGGDGNDLTLTVVP